MKNGTSIMIKQFNTKKIRNLNFTVAHLYHLFQISFAVVILSLSFGCENHWRIRVSDDSPPTFYFSGGGQLNFFQVKDSSDKILWKLYPKDSNVYLWKISSIKYGEVPSSCTQYIPKDSFPPPLIEGEIYYASGNTGGAPTANITFTIKDGKVVELSHDP
jgi:hypothetical protein